LADIESLLLLGGILSLAGILSSKVSIRASVPVLVLFIGVGMLAGSEGVGGIDFEDYRLSHGVGTLALALILFDGGLRSPAESLRSVWRPALALSTIGVALTALLTGVAAAWIVGLPLFDGLLIGAIVSSTDAAAVFAILRGRGVRLPERLKSTLEFESGSNDPMAILLTLGLIEIALGRMEPGFGFLVFFFVQMGAGAAVGLIVGRLGVRLLNAVDLDSEGLYPILATTFGVLSFGVAHVLGGNGFLATYLTGIVVGNAPLVFRRGILLFHDGAAWMAQIAMFVLLGLLSFPSALVAAAPQGLLLAGVLMVVARPLTVFALLAPFRFRFREILVISWAGLKGAVPIILATYPLLAGLPGARRIFDIVFFTVLLSALTQGWTLPLVARWLGLQRPPVRTPAVSLEISSLRHVNAEAVEYPLLADSRVVGMRLREIPLPEGALVAMVAREHRALPPTGSTVLRAGDFVFVVMTRDLRPLVDLLFLRGGPGLPSLVEFPLRGTTRAGEIREFYGLDLSYPEDTTVEEILRELLGSRVRIGDFAALGGCMLIAREVSGERITQVGLEMVTDPEPTPD